MQEDIDYYMELGKTWDDLVADKLILKGDAESVPLLSPVTIIIILLLRRLEKIFLK